MANPDLVDLWGFNYGKEEKEDCRGDVLPSVVDVCLRMLQNALQRQRYLFYTLDTEGCLHYIIPL